MKFFFSLNWSKGLCNLLPWHMSVVVLSWFYMFIFSVTPGPIATKLCRDDFYYFIYKTSSFLLDPANIVATMSTSWFWLNENKKKKKSPNYSWTKISLWFCFEKNHGSHGKFLSPKLPNSFIQVSDSGSDGPRVILKEIDGVSYKIQG